MYSNEKKKIEVNYDVNENGYLISKIREFESIKDAIDFVRSVNSNTIPIIS